MEIANTLEKPTLSTCSLSHGFNPAATLARFICRAMTALSGSFSSCFPTLFLSMLDRGKEFKSHKESSPQWPLDFVLLTYLADRKERKRVETSSSRWEVDQISQRMIHFVRTFKRTKSCSHWLQTLFRVSMKNFKVRRYTYVACKITWNIQSGFHSVHKDMKIVDIYANSRFYT